MKKRLALVLCILTVLAIILSSCSPSIQGGGVGTGTQGSTTGNTTDGADGNTTEGNTTEGSTDSNTEGETNAPMDDIVLNMTGKEAAELLLAHVRLDENRMKDQFNFGSDLSENNTLMNNVPIYDMLVSSKNYNEYVKLDSQTEDALTEWLENDGFDIEGTIWKWTDFKDYSNDISFYSSYIVSIESSAESFARLISTIKTQMNITDKWIVIGGQKLLLTVSESSETVYNIYEESNSIQICNHYVDDSGKDVYEMFSCFADTDGSIGTTYMVYIDSTYYEFCYDYVPSDGAIEKYFRPRIIIDNSKGYWNMLCIGDVAADMQGNSTHLNVGNLVVKDDIIYQFQTMLLPDSKIADSNFSFSIISPDWKNDIITISGNGKNIDLHINGFTGVKGVQLDTSKSDGDYCQEIFPFGNELPMYEAWGPNVETVLENGRVIKSGDKFAEGSLEVSRTIVNLDAGPRLYFASLELKYLGEDVSVNSLIAAVEAMLSECGMSAKCEMSSVAKGIEEVMVFSKAFGSIYEWNGKPINTLADFKAATQVLEAKYGMIDTLYNAAKELPTVELDNYLEPLPEELDFAKFSGYSYGKITLDGAVITAEEMIATLPEHVLFDNGEQYVLRLGLRKYGEDGVSTTETIVVLHGDNEVYSTFEQGNAISFLQGSSYTIPSNLCEGKFLLVAFVATADEGIRVSETVPIASVDFTTGVVESEVADITYEVGENNTLIVISASKLYTEYTLSMPNGYDLATLIDELNIAVMSKGALIDGAALEAFDLETKEATPLAEDFVLVAGTYRLKYLSGTHGGADAYIYCVVTEEMLEVETETETGTDNTETGTGNTETGTETGTENTETQTQADSSENQ